MTFSEINRIIYLTSFLFISTFVCLAQTRLEDLNIIHKHDFENNTIGNYSKEEWKSDWLSPSWQNRLSETEIINDETDKINPTKALQVSFPAKSLGISEGGVQWFTYINGQEELYVSYDLLFMPGFEFQLGGKLPSVQGGSFNSPGAPTGYDGFSGGLSFAQNGQIRFYIFYPDQTGEYGESIIWGYNYKSESLSPSKAIVEYTIGTAVNCNPGNWHNITYRIVLNTINSLGKGNHDGILEAYFNGKLVLQLSHLIFRHTKNLKIDCMRMYSFFGGNTDDFRNPIDEWLRIDNVMLYTYKSNIDVPRGNKLSPKDRTINYWRLFSTMPNTPPTAPTTLAMSTNAKSSIGLKWKDNAANEQGFIVYRSASFNGTFTEIGRVTANVTSFTDKSLSPGTTYYYRVGAYNAAGSSAYSNTLTGKTLELQLPAAPSSLTASTQTKTSITLAWTDNATNESGFNIYRSLSSSSGFTKIAAVGVNTTAYTDNGLEIGTKYYYRINAYNADGTSAYTPVLSTSTMALQPPAAPTGFASSTQTKYSITLAWTDNAKNEQGFSIWRAASADGEYSEIAKPAANAASYTNSNLNAATTYYYKIRAYNDDGVSAFTTALAATTKPLEPPAAPSGLIASYIEYESATIVWKDNATNENGFELIRNLADNNTQIKAITLAAGITSYTDTTLDMNTSYQYRIRALNGDGTSAWSNMITVVTPRLLPPAPPTKLKSTKYTDKSISVSWKDNSGNEDAFVITRSLATDPASAVDIAINANDTAFTDSSLVSSTTYQYTIKAVNRGGSSSSSNKNVATTLSHAELKRVKDGLIAYYNFGFNPDYIVYDQSGYGDPLNLNILDRTAANWNKDNTLDILSNTAIVSLVPATKVIQAIKQTGEITFECWLRPKEPVFSMPARIASISAGDSELGFALDQQLVETFDNKELSYHVRMQTASTVSSGYPEYTPDVVQPYINLQHLVYTRNTRGMENFYLNGVKSSEGFRPSELDTWKDNYYLRLGNESDMNHSWTGSFYSVALFNKELSADEVMVNYSTGPCDSVEMENVDYTINVFPNPAVDQVYLQITPVKLTDNVPHTTICIWDAFGKLQYRQNLFNPNESLIRELPFNNLPAGIYLVQVISGSKQQSAKVILQK